MCDYSLEHYRSRPAREGERYVTHRFESGSIGFTSPGDCRTAVCIPRDTRLHLSGIPETVQRSLGVGPEAEATFAEVPSGRCNDGVEFAPGKVVSLQYLGEGVTATMTRDLAMPFGLGLETIRTFVGMH